MNTVRRTFLKNSAAAAVATVSAAWPSLNFAQTPVRRDFAPQSGGWRTFEVTTRVDIVKPEGVTRLWLPIPSVNSDYQRSLESSFSSNGTTQLTQDGRDGAKMLYVEFAATEAKPFALLTSRVQTQGRAVDWSQ
ncbi:MAG: twin-arginine translocation signal domain-containing protein, partial [Polaromonas sp.]